MNKKILVGMSLLTAASAFAQYSFEPTSAPSTEASAPAPAPVAAAPATSAKTADFDQLRGNAYGIIPNEAAASTIGGNMAKPHKMAGQKLLYVEPADEGGVVSFGPADRTYFLGLDNSNDLGLLTVGLANKASWGLALSVALSKTWTTTETNQTAEATAVEKGDRVGLAFSMPTGGNELAASVDWYTHTDELSSKNGGAEIDVDYTTLAFDVNMGNGPSAKELFWTAGLGLERYASIIEVGSASAIDEDTRVSANLYWNAGLKVLGNEKARVLLGSNNSLIFELYDDVKDVQTGHMETAVLLSPNILGEYSFTQNWLVFGGATHDLKLFSYGAKTEGTGDAEVKSSAMQMYSNATVATAGLRYQKDRFAAEAVLSDNVFTNGVSEVFQGNNTLISFGGFLYF
jgi:hypothetical protein